MYIHHKECVASFKTSQTASKLDGFKVGWLQSWTASKLNGFKAGRLRSWTALKLDSFKAGWPVSKLSGGCKLDINIHCSYSCTRVHTLKLYTYITQLIPLIVYVILKSLPENVEHGVEVLQLLATLCNDRERRPFALQASYIHVHVHCTFSN